MKNIQNLFLGLLVLLLSSSASWSMGKQPSKVVLSEPSPQLYIYNVSQDQLEIFPYVVKGKISVVSFLSYECPLSREKIERADEFLSSLEEKNRVVMVGVSSMPYEGIRSLKRYQKNESILFDLLYDQDAVLATQFQVDKAPHFYVFDRQQVLRYHGNEAGMEKAVLGLIYDLDDFLEVAEVRGCPIPASKKKHTLLKEQQKADPVKDHPSYMASPEIPEAPQKDKVTHRSRPSSKTVTFSNSM